MKSIITLVVVSLLATAPATVADSQEAAPTVLPDDCRLDARPAFEGFFLRCGEENKACGVLAQPACWSVRFVCWGIGYQTEKMLWTHCGTQPGCCGNLTSNRAYPAASPWQLLQQNCDNYGIEVNLVVGSHPCYGETCKNTGVRASVAVAGSHCGQRGITVCLAQHCSAVRPPPPVSF
ncbi:MAG: hypothetical protein ACPGQL_00725 [Thermoplasmatota archaeon]